MKEKNKWTVSIIGGADGPTSVFVVGASGKKPLKIRVKNWIYKYKSKRAKKRILAGSHTLEEVVAYARDKYRAAEIDKNRRKYVEEWKNLRESLIIRHKPELLGDMKEIKKPAVYNEDSIRELHRQIQLRSEMIAQIPDYEMPMDFHIYEIKIDDGWVEIAIDYVWNIFGISYGGSRGSKKALKKLEKITQDLYIYYGVTEEDIRNRTERYSALLATLSM